MFKNSSVRTLALAIAAAAMSSTAFAGQTAPATMTVTATVAASCVLSSVTNVSFGTYVPGTESDSTGAFTLNCTTGSPVSVSISGGNGTGHNQGTDTRAMLSGSNFLSYDLFQDGGHTTAWPVSGGVATTGTGSAARFNVYGRVSSGLNGIVAGSYSDTVNIVASF
jgi:spore coat protein U-like protein